MVASLNDAQKLAIYNLLDTLKFWAKFYEANSLIFS